VRQILLFGAALLAASSLSAATHRKPAKGKKATHATVSSRSKTGRKTKTKAKGRAVSHSHGPQAPSPERYREIQQKLADKGFFHGPVDGNWNSDSVDALKRFQKEQGLEPDGKLGSLSLIAMGLGPKRLAAQSSEPPAASVPPPAGPQK
jgi:peptidoglycan hydrolase-like protein with peptidoglycan-binding domain